MATRIEAPVQMLILECAECTMTFGITKSFEQQRREDHNAFHCPAGHENVYYAMTEEEKLQKKLDQEIQRRKSSENSLRSTRGYVTRLKKEKVNG